MNHQSRWKLPKKMIHAARSKAEELKILEDIAVVDASGISRRSFVWIAPGLAVLTSPSEKLERPVILIWTQPKSGRCHSRPASLRVEHSNGGLITFGGGIPIKDVDGTVIGAIGVSGSTVDNDVKVANAAVEACNGRKFATA